MLENYADVIGWAAAICIVIAGILPHRTVSLYLNAVGSCCLIVYGGLTKSGIIIFLSSMLTGIRLYQLDNSSRRSVGCIIIGYQGIGKSRLAAVNSRYVDVESSLFYVEDHRDINWYQPYCKLAIDLAIQGYRVFVSSHLSVREYLTSIELPPSLKLYVCYPSLKLKDDWIQRLKDRQEQTRLPKDIRAYHNALEGFDANIAELQMCSGYHIELTDIQYNLDSEINKAIQRSSKNF